MAGREKLPPPSPGILAVFSVGQNKTDFAICCFRQFYFLPEGNMTHREFLADKFPRRLNRFAMQEKEIVTFFSYQIAPGKLLEQERIILSRIPPIDRLQTSKTNCGVEELW